MKATTKLGRYVVEVVDVLQVNWLIVSSSVLSVFVVWNSLTGHSRVLSDFVCEFMSSPLYIGMDTECW